MRLTSPASGAIFYSLSNRLRGNATLAPPDGAFPEGLVTPAWAQSPAAWRSWLAWDAELADVESSRRLMAAPRPTPFSGNKFTCSYTKTRVLSPIVW